VIPRNVKVSVDARGLGRVEVDGHDLKGVRGFTLTSEVGCLPQITLDLHVYDVSTFAEADILVPSGVAETLVALGWTPPHGQEVGTDAAP